MRRTSASLVHGNTSQIFHIVPVKLSVYRATSKGGEQVIAEESHEADESHDSCYCSLDVCVCGAALLRLV
jgi:hypothetical protein